MTTSGLALLLSTDLNLSWRSFRSRRPANGDVVALRGGGHYFNKRLGAHNVWEIDVDEALIDAACELNCIGSTSVDAYEMCANWLADEQKDHYDRVRTPAGSFFARRSVKWSMLHGNDLGWVSVDDRASYERFERLFERMRLPERFAACVPHAEKLRLFSAFYVVRSHCSTPSWHADYTESAGCSALTLLKPLYGFDETDSFQLLYRARGLDAEGAAASGNSGGQEESAVRYVRRAR